MKTAPHFKTFFVTLTAAATRDGSRRRVSPSTHNQCANERKMKTEDEVCCVDVCQRHWNGRVVRNSPRLRETSIIYNAPIGLVARTRNERCRVLVNGLTANWESGKFPHDDKPLKAPGLSGSGCGEVSIYLYSTDTPCHLLSAKPQCSSFAVPARSRLNDSKIRPFQREVAAIVQLT